MVKLGKAFSDNINVVKSRWSLPRTHMRGWGVRLTFFYGFVILGFFLLIVRLFHLTIVQGSENRSLSDNNRVKSITIHAPRGTLYDRTGIALTKNIPAFRITGPCEEGKSCKIKRVTQESYRAKGDFVDSVFLERDSIRSYVYPYEMAHLIGYLSEIGSEELSNPAYVYQGYIKGDWLGRLGLEAALEKKLRGVDGKELIEVDAQGKRLRSLGKVDAIPGQDVRLTIDIKLQQVAYASLGESPGAVVVTKPRTGEILAIASNPSFDPNKFHEGMSPQDYEKLINGPDKPLFNRAISGVFPPGSTFKIISAIAGLESGRMSKSATIEDTGILHIGDFSFSNWYFTQYGGTDGVVDMVKALARSNDIYFYKLGEIVGIKNIAEWGKKFGIGEKTGIEIAGEAQGLMPDPEYKQKVRNEDWYTGDSYLVSIGQGDLQTTPIQVNRWTNIIASSGVMCDYTIFSRDQKKSKCIDTGIKQSTIDTITEGMRRACSDGGNWNYAGTGYPFFDFTVLQEEITETEAKGTPRKIPVACKTGTAELGDADSNTHAWFTVFAPLPDQKGEGVVSGDPEIVATVLVEKGGEGSKVAAPIAKKILEEWFSR